MFSRSDLASSAPEEQAFLCVPKSSFFLKTGQLYLAGVHHTRSSCPPAVFPLFPQTRCNWEMGIVLQDTGSPADFLPCFPGLGAQLLVLSISQLPK